MTEDQITGEIAKDIREKLGMRQSKFWNPIGVQQSVASRYEQGLSPIPQSVRILLVANYVAGVRIDTTTPEGVEGLSKLGSMQSSHSAARSIASSTRKELNKAADSIKKAADSLQSI